MRSVLRFNTDFSSTSSFRSTPQLAGRQSGALRQGGELEVSHARMSIGVPQGEFGIAAGGCSQDVIAADEFGRPHDALGVQLWMIQQIGGAADRARYRYLTGGQVDLLEDMVFVIVRRVRPFNRVGVGIDF